MGETLPLDETATSSNNAAARALQTVQSTGVPLWALVVVVISGTVIIVAGLVFALIFTQRWMRRRRRRKWRRRRLQEEGRRREASGPRRSSSDEVVVDGEEEAEEEEAEGWGRGRGSVGGKLQKRQRDASTDMDVSEGETGGMRVASSPESSTSEEGGRWKRKLWRRSSLPPVLPQLFAGRFSAGFLSVASFSSRGERAAAGEQGVRDEEQQHRRKMSNTWIDEDAIHGPIMNVSPSRRSRHSKGKSPGRGSIGGDKSRRSSWRRSLSFRDSWPLRSISISPTLPRLAHFGSPRAEVAEDELGIREPTPTAAAYGSGAPPVFRLQHHLRGHAVPNLPMPPGDAGQGYSPPRQLPKPPTQALLAASAEVAGVAHGRSNSWHSANGGGRMSPGQYLPRDRVVNHHAYEDAAATGSPSRSSARASPATMGRMLTSTDSELSLILEGTERRLQEGVVTGAGAGSSVRWHRTSTSPSKRALAPSAISRGSSHTISGAEANGSSATLVGTASRTPSPQKPSKSGAGHVRQDSQNSIASDPNSLLADQTPGPEHYHGLTSPTKQSPSKQSEPQRQYQPQMIIRRPSVAASVVSSIESALSDIDERNSEDATDVPMIVLGSSNPANRNKIAGPAGGRAPIDDPFVSLSTSPVGSERGAKGSGLPVSRAVHAFNDAPRLPGGPSTRSDTIAAYALRSADGPLSTISGNSRSPEVRPRSHSNANDKITPTSVFKVQTPQHSQRAGNAAACTPAPPTSAVSSTSNLHKRQLSTVHDVEDDDDDDEGETVMMSIPGLSLTSPSEKDKNSPASKRLNDMRARPSSPTLGRSRERTPDIPPPSPALPRNTPRLSSLYEFYSDLPADNQSFSSVSTHRRAAGEVRKISGDSTNSSRYSDLEKIKTNILNEINKDVLHKNAQPFHQSIRLVPPEDGPMPAVSSTVAQLRRMNSQVSSMYNSDGSPANSPLLPTLREETGRFVSPPRKKEAARNYLSLGVSPKSGIKGGDDVNGNHNDKENEGVGGLELKMPKAELDEGVVLRQGGASKAFDTPAAWRRHFQPGEGSPVRKSSESLGLYDADGFWISPERRASRKR